MNRSFFKVIYAIHKLDTLEKISYSASWFYFICSIILNIRFLSSDKQVDFISFVLLISAFVFFLATK